MERNANPDETVNSGRTFGVIWVFSKITMAQATRPLGQSICHCRCWLKAGEKVTLRWKQHIGNKTNDKHKMKKTCEKDVGKKL